MTPFTSCGRMWGKGRLCDLALNVQVRTLIYMYMASEMFH